MVVVILDGVKRGVRARIWLNQFKLPAIRYDNIAMAARSKLSSHGLDSFAILCSDIFVLAWLVLWLLKLWNWRVEPIVTKLVSFD